MEVTPYDFFEPLEFLHQTLKTFRRSRGAAGAASESGENAVVFI